MIRGIDHLVIVVNDLAQATNDYQQLGFTVVSGGQHPVGSHNALIAFRDASYLEIISFYRDAVDHRWWDPLSKGERLVDFCFQTDDLRGDTEKLRAAGVAINNPVPWSRKRPDGYELKWLLSLATGSDRGVAPFLIEDVTPRTERVPQKFHHQNGVSGILKVSVAVDELAPVEKWYRALLGGGAENIVNEDLHAEGLAFHVGPHVVEFLTPRDNAGPLTDWLRQFGSSPYSAVLKGDGVQDKALDIRLSHGAELIVR